jgi:hypothetical protein
LGVKVFRISTKQEVTELADIPTLDHDVVSAKLASFSGSTFRLLISDTISYLFHSQIPRSNTPVSREIVLQKIKGEIPENFESSSWDYKIINQNTDFTEVIVFSPVAEFQNFINQISTKLQLNFEVIEPESIAVTRHPNPIVGILHKDDLGLKDEQSLNIIVNTPASHQRNHFPKGLLTF